MHSVVMGKTMKHRPSQVKLVQLNSSQVEAGCAPLAGRVRVLSTQTSATHKSAQLCNHLMYMNFNIT